MTTETIKGFGRLALAGIVGLASMGGVLNIAGGCDYVGARLELRRVEEKDPAKAYGLALNSSRYYDHDALGKIIMVDGSTECHSTLERLRDFREAGEQWAKEHPDAVISTLVDDGGF
jgi:hypothetical protein